MKNGDGCAGAFYGGKDRGEIGVRSALLKNRMKRRAVFLDRDGVINEAVLRDGVPHPPSGLAELRLADGAAECLRDLRQAGFCLIVVTNQPDVARGRQTRNAVEEIHAHLAARLPVDDFFACYHDDSDRCECRKPLPGMLLQAAEKHNIELARSFLIGDRWRDVEAGERAGCTTVLIDHQYPGKRAAADFETDSLRRAVDWILERAQRC